MTQTYRTTDLAKWGTGKGSDLSPAEVDDNFWTAIQRIVALEARPEPAAAIDHFEVSGTSFYVVLTDATVLGPYELPVATFTSRGDWMPSTIYNVLDTVSYNGGLYVVLFDHTSDLTFDPGANDGSGHDYYGLMLTIPGNSLPSGGATGQVLTKATSGDYVVTYTWKFPEGGTTGQFLRMRSSTQDDAEWSDGPTADEVEFTPVTGSALTSDNVADALQELSNQTLIENIEYVPDTGSGLEDTNVEDALNTLGARTAPGRQTIWMPASGMTPRLTDGAEHNQTETASNLVITTLDFDPDTVEYAQFEVAMPKSWDRGDIGFKFYWLHDVTAGSTGVIWAINGGVVNNGDDIDWDFTAHETSVFHLGGDGGTLHITSETDPITMVDVNDSPTEEDNCLLMFTIFRDADNTSDNMSIDARLWGVQLYYDTSTNTDT